MAENLYTYIIRKLKSTKRHHAPKLDKVRRLCSLIERSRLLVRWKPNPLALFEDECE